MGDARQSRAVVTRAMIVSRAQWSRIRDEEKEEKFSGRANFAPGRVQPRAGRPFCTVIPRDR